MPRLTPSPLAIAERWRVELEDYVVAVGCDGGQVHVGLGGGGLVALEAVSGARRWACTAHPGGVLALDARATRVLSAGQDGSAALRSPAGQVLAEVRASGRRAPWIEQAVIAPDGRSFALGLGPVVQWHDETGALRFAAPPLPSTVTGLAFRPGGGALAACAYGGVRLFALDALDAPRELSWKGSLLSLAWSPNAKVIACASQDSSVHFWRLPSGADSEMSGYPGRIAVVTWDASSQLLATSSDATLTLWDFAGRGPEGSRPIQLEGHLTKVTCAAFHPQKGLLASGSSCGEVRFFRPRAGRTPAAGVDLRETPTVVAWAGDLLLVGTAEGCLVALGPSG